MSFLRSFNLFFLFFRWHNWRFAEEIDKKYNLVLLHVDTMPSKTGQTEVAAFSIRTPFNEKQVEILQYDMYCTTQLNQTLVSTANFLDFNNFSQSHPLFFYGFREFVCPVAPADGCFHPEVLERHRLRRNSKGTWEYRCPGKEKAKKCWKAKEGVEWFIRRVLHESLNRKAVLCYLDFYDVSNSGFEKKSSPPSLLISLLRSWCPSSAW